MIAVLYRFDRLVYLDVTNEVDSRVKILEALTRGCVLPNHMITLCITCCYSINLHDDVSLYSVAKCCPDNVTGADLFAVCNEATKSALRHTIHELEDRGV